MNGSNDIDKIRELLISKDQKMCSIRQPRRPVPQARPTLHCSIYQAGRKQLIPLIQSHLSLRGSSASAQKTKGVLRTFP